MAHAEEPSPFGSYDAAAISDDVIPHEPQPREEGVASVLESPFVSAQIDEDEFQLFEKKAQAKEQKAQDKSTGQPQMACMQTNSTSSTCTNVSSVPSTAAGLGKGNMNKAPSSGVADMLESPFVSACLSQDLRDVAETLANAAAAAEQLSSAKLL